MALNLLKPGILIGKLEKPTISPEVNSLYEMCNRKKLKLNFRNIYRMSGREGVRLYKALHRTVQRVFKGDSAAMFAARDKVTAIWALHEIVSKSKILDTEKDCCINQNFGRCVKSLIRAEV